MAEVAGIAALGLATKILKPKALVLKGELAENGKSQILDVLRALLPKSAVASISPARFDDRTFTCHLDGKLLNAPDELASGDAIASETFKQIITGEPLTVRDLYKSAFEFRPVAQHVYATNNLPSFRGGMDRGVRRRLMVLCCNRVIPVDERIDHIGLRIGREESDLLLDWAVRGASRVIARQAFTEPSSSAEALRDWMLSSDPVLGWLDSEAVRFAMTVGPEVRTKIAYSYFRQWAIEEGYPAGQAACGQRLLAARARRHGRTGCHEEAHVRGRRVRRPRMLRHHLLRALTDAEVGPALRSPLPPGRQPAFAAPGIRYRAGGCGLLPGFVSCFAMRVISLPPTKGCKSNSRAFAASFA